MTDIIIDTEERFIGKHLNHRISIVKADGSFDIDVQDKTHMNIMEMRAWFENIEDAKSFTQEYLDRLLK